MGEVGIKNLHRKKAETQAVRDGKGGTKKREDRTRKKKKKVTMGSHLSKRSSLVQGKTSGRGNDGVGGKTWDQERGGSPIVITESKNFK